MNAAERLPVGRPGYEGYDSRREALIDFFADREPGGYLNRVCLIEVAAKLYRRRDLQRAFDLLDRILDDPHGDMFWMYPMTLVRYVGRDVLPEATLRRMRDLWRTYTPYRGDTENHWVMYYASLYLMAQMYPEDGPETWFNGRSSQENRRESEGFLNHWIELTTTIGQGEYDSPHYMGFFITPMALLYAFAEEETMRRKAGMMLDYLIADFAAENLNGLYAGAMSRIYPEPALERWKNGSTSFAWLLFGNIPFRPDPVNVVLPRVGYRPHGITLILALSGYRLPEIIHHIATDRSTPYVHRELKRTRHRIRYSGVRNAPVYKYMSMRREYALGSSQGGLLQPVQQHTWELLWTTDDPHRGFNVLFTVQPYSSGHELGMYFPEEPELLTEAVISGEKPTYDQPDKLTGGSPYEQVFQDEDALVALYHIAPGTRFPHINGYFSRDLQSVSEDPSGWIFADVEGLYLAYRPLAPYQWRDLPGGDRRLYSAALNNGAVVQVAPRGAYRSRADFEEAVRGLALEVEMERLPRVRYRSLSGRLLEAEWGREPRVDGREVGYAQWPLYGGMFLEAERGSGRLEMRYGGMRRLLDFRTLSVTDRVEPDES